MHPETQMAIDCGLLPTGPKRDAKAIKAMAEEHGPGVWSRQTGRTTSMVLRALVAAKRGESVVVLVPTEAVADQIRATIKDLGSKSSVDTQAVHVTTSVKDAFQGRRGHLVLKDHTWDELARPQDRIAALDALGV